MFIRLILFISCISIFIEPTNPPKSLTPLERVTVARYQRMLLLDYAAQCHNNPTKKHTITYAIRNKRLDNPEKFIAVLQWYNFPHLRHLDPEMHEILLRQLTHSPRSKKIFKVIADELPSMSIEEAQKIITASSLKMTKSIVYPKPNKPAQTNEKNTDQPTARPILQDSFPEDFCPEIPQIQPLSRISSIRGTATSHHDVPAAAAACAYHDSPMPKTTVTTSATTHESAHRMPFNPDTQQQFIRAIKDSDSSQFMFFLQHGADLNKGIHGTYQAKPPFIGVDYVNPLDQAIIRGNADMVRLLIEMGATVTERHKEKSWCYYFIQITQRKTTDAKRLARQKEHLNDRKTICCILDPDRRHGDTFFTHFNNTPK